jgi:hypothetical protein
VKMLVWVASWHMDGLLFFVLINYLLWPLIGSDGVWGSHTPSDRRRHTLSIEFSLWSPL